MFAAVTSTWALFLGIGLMMLGNGLQGTLLGVRAAMEGFPTAVTGAVMTGYYIGFLAGSTITPRIVQRVGHIRVFAALASLASSAVLLYTIFLDPIPWFAMRVVTGFSYAGLYVVVESWINDRATNETRGRLLSVYMVVVFGSMACGQFLLNVADPGGVELFILIAVLVSIALIPISLTATQAPQFSAPVPVSLRRLYRTSPLGAVGVFGTGVAHGALFGMGAVYAKIAGLSLGEISAFMGALVLGGMALQWPVGRVSDSFDRRKVLTAVTLAAAVLCVVAIWFSSRSVTGLIVTVFLLGGASLPMYSLCLAHTNDHLEPSEMVGAGSALVLLSGMGSALGPFSVSTLMAALGTPGFFWFIAGTHAAIGGFAIYRMTRRPSAAPREAGARTRALAAFFSTSLSQRCVRDSRDLDLARMSSRR